MFKRLAGSEFCSDAHRREYKEEYSQLALGRLLQSKPSETQERGRVVGDTVVTVFVEDKPSAALIAKGALPVVSKAAPVMMPPAQTNVSPENSVSALALAEPAAIQKTSDPAIAALISVQKPAPVGRHLAVGGTPEFERTLASLKPDQPSCYATMPHAALPEGSLIRLDRGMEVADSVMHPRERKLELRESARTAAGMGLNLGIAGPESLEPHIQPLIIPAPSAVAPAEASLWTEDPRHFTGSVIALGDAAKFQLSTTGFEAGNTPLSGPDAAQVVAVPKTADDPVCELQAREIPGLSNQVPDTAGIETAAEETGDEHVAIPEPALKPLAVMVPAVGAGKGKAVQVFGPASFNAGTVQVPQPTGLPLRPLMVLASETVKTVPPTKADVAKSKVSVLRPTRGAPSQPELGTPIQTSVESGLGFPNLRLPSSPNTVALRMPTILAAVAAAVVVIVGSFLALTNRDDAGPSITISAPAGSEQWITNFAPAPKLERNVSVLRSTLSLTDYRLEFESSIQIKALGWVYRAQDSKNFYAGKIELEKAGLSPKYVIAHYAVIGGVDQPRAQAPLNITVPLGGFYKIRLEAVGNHFTTWIQDQIADEWTDPRLSAGGAGLYREGIEQSTLHGDFRVTPLSKKK